MSSVTFAPAGRPNVLSNTLTIARRNLLHIKATPEQLVEMSIQPIMFLVLFVYVFGGAIAGSSNCASVNRPEPYFSSARLSPATVPGTPTPRAESRDFAGSGLPSAPRKICGVVAAGAVSR